MVVSDAELKAWLRERRKTRQFLQSCPLLKLPSWYNEEVSVAADWALERGYEAAEEWRGFHPRVVRDALEHGVDPSGHGQPKWKTVWMTDMWLLRADWTGYYPAELEIAEEGEHTPGGDAEALVFNEDGNRWHLRDADGNMTVSSWENADEAEEQIGFQLRDIDANYLVYTVRLEQQKIIKDENGDDRIVPIAWTPAWRGLPSSREEWFVDKLGDVARSTGGEVKTLIKLLTSDDPRDLASAYIDIVGYYGAHEFDQEPMRLSEAEFNERWSK